MTEKKFIADWIIKLNEEGLKEFPGAFLKTDELKEIVLPGKTLVIGKEFFGSYEILSTDGESVYQAASLDEAKYIVYSSRDKSSLIKIPADGKYTREALSLYNEYLDAIIKHIETDYKKIFPREKKSNYIVNEIFKRLNLTRY